MLLEIFTVVLSLFVVSSGEASGDFARLQNDFFNWRMSDRPVVATYHGIQKYNDQLESYNMSMAEVRKNKAAEIHNRLKAIPKSELNKNDMTIYGILDDRLNTYIAGYKWRNYQHLNIITFLDGPQIFPSSFIDILPFYTRGDFDNYIVRLQKMPQQFAEITDLMREAIRLGRTNHNVSMSRIAEQFSLLNVTYPIQSVYYGPFNDTLESSTVAEEDRAGLRQRAKVAVAGVLQAFEDLWNFIQQEYMPNTRSEIGISSLDGGREYYEACIRWYLSENRTAQEVHDIGLQEVNRILKNMQKIMTKQGFSGTPGEYFQSLRSDPRFTFNTGEEVLTEFRNEIKDITRKLPNIPDLPLEVRALPYDGPLGQYTSGTRDGSVPGIFWANVHRPKQSVNFTTIAVTLHETVPGHHLQFSHAKLAKVSDFMQKMKISERVPFFFPRDTAYVEGWALYAEALGEELGVYRDDYDLMGRYSYQIFRAVRLVVDTGMNVFGWSRERALQYVLNYTSESYESASVEIDRYITWPGQALAYKIGEMKFLELRRKAERKLGSKFDVRTFHCVVLGSGTLPLNVLENLVDDWIDSKTTPTTCGTAKVRYMWTVILVAVLIGYI